jgi:hypothetical protein
MQDEVSFLPPGWSDDGDEHRSCKTTELRTRRSTLNEKHKRPRSSSPFPSVLTRRSSFWRARTKAKGSEAQRQKKPLGRRDSSEVEHRPPEPSQIEILHKLGKQSKDMTGSSGPGFVISNRITKGGENKTQTFCWFLTLIAMISSILPDNINWAKGLPFFDLIFRARKKTLIDWSRGHLRELLRL